MPVLAVQFLSVVSGETEAPPESSSSDLSQMPSLDRGESLIRGGLTSPGFDRRNAFPVPSLDITEVRGAESSLLLV